MGKLIVKFHKTDVLSKNIVRVFFDLKYKNIIESFSTNSILMLHGNKITDIRNEIKANVKEVMFGKKYHNPSITDDELCLYTISEFKKMRDGKA
jgi:hypothetical protein